MDTTNKTGQTPVTPGGLGAAPERTADVRRLSGIDRPYRQDADSLRQAAVNRPGEVTAEDVTDNGGPPAAAGGG